MKIMKSNQRGIPVMDASQKNMHNTKYAHEETSRSIIIMEMQGIRDTSNIH